jgi:hypothetical protein
VLAEVGTGIERRDSGDRLGEGEDETAVDQAGDIGDEDLLGDIPPGVAERVEDTTGLGKGCIS